jgi:hypothetical protein
MNPSITTSLEEKKEQVCEILTSLFPIQIKKGRYFTTVPDDTLEENVTRITWNQFLVFSCDNVNHTVSGWDSFKVGNSTWKLWFSEEQPWRFHGNDVFELHLDNWINNSELSCLATWKYCEPILSQYLIPDIVMHILKPHLVRCINK